MLASWTCIYKKQWWGGDGGKSIWNVHTENIVLSLFLGVYCTNVKLSITTRTSFYTVPWSAVGVCFLSLLLLSKFYLMLNFFSSSSKTSRVMSFLSVLNFQKGCRVVFCKKLKVLLLLQGKIDNILQFCYSRLFP